MQSRREVLDQRRDQFDAVLASLQLEGRQVALVDFPDHDNVGDNLIWRGQREALRRIGSRVVHTTSLGRASWRLLAGLPTGVTILCSGGGNLGDIYPWSQAFRGELLRAVPRHRVILLPQSMYFSSDDGRQQCADGFHRHGDAHVRVRDRRSLAEAQAMGLSVNLSPDAAFGVPEETLAGYSHSSAQEVVAVWRKDDEAARSGVPQGVAVHDWLLQGPTRRRRWEDKAHGALRRAEGRVPGPARARRALYDASAAREVQRGFRLIEDAGILLTDRLHAALMGMMTGRRVVWSDNSYGKLSDVLGEWVPGLPGVWRADDRAHAVQIAGRLVLG